MKRLINITITALFLLAVNASNAYAASIGSVRERLANDPGVGSLYTIDDNFSVISVKNSGVEAKDFTVVKEFSSNGRRYQIIRHSEAEPFMYKGSAAPEYSTVQMLPNGEFNLNEEGYGIADLYEHLYAVCRKSNGTASFIIPVKYGQYKRLTQIAAVDAFSYMLSSDNGNGSWFIACDGASRFVAEKNYSFKGLSQTVNIRSNRGFEGVSYIKTGKEVADLVAYQARAISAKDEATVLEETALEAAALGTDFVKVHNGVRYTAAFKNAENGCGSVEIKKTVSTENMATAKLYDYEVCLDKASKVGEKEITPDAARNMYANALIEPVK
ncbi:MAG: hypothetical protein HY891_08305 [Deltaproteobacteria bacterium]|nr:hypothetical protein [Deltaproteobacteria bacterium]